ncbi:alpha/beta hydrolase family protein [Pontibacterium sp.]|uniref:alpha/beta hydrolase family protein n=1 Tax=Pontibacterium sp. TaxID=2036026 RepID=UPI003515FE66
MSEAQGMLPTSPHPPGLWPSSFTAEHALQGIKEYGQLQAAPNQQLFWVEYQPENDGHTVICSWQGGVIKTVSPPHISVRSRVHEYGGQSWCLLDQSLVFVHGDDQQLWLQPFDGEASRLTHTSECRYGAPVWDRPRNRLIAVQEEHPPGDIPADVINRLVSVSLEDGGIAVLHEGFDFYDQVALGADSEGGLIAWISWEHPDQPWTETQLLFGRLDDQGQIDHVQALGHEQALTQPQFDAQGRLHVVSDHNNWWQIYRVEQQPDRIDLALLPGQDEAEYAAASWQLGQSSYLLLDDGWVALSHRDGMGALQLHRDGRTERIATQYSNFRSLTMSGSTLYCVASSTTASPALIAVDLESGNVESLTGGQRPLPIDEIAEPQHLRFNVGNEYAYALFYPPTNSAEQSAQLPPLVVFLHGGPTSAAYPIFNPKIQYWTQRGFAVADLNYRGSTGYGRDYRMKLRKQWGVADVEDAIALVEHLGEQELINPAQVFIRGGSAGGYTALAALAASACFTAGASLYGVSDLNALCVTTHKFESRYLDWLIGDAQYDGHVYQERSPVTNADQISSPVIFFQGLLDKVVPPEQTDLMVSALRANGVEVEVHRYADEYHGFRDPAVQQEVLELELAFYQRWL